MRPWKRKPTEAKYAAKLARIVNPMQRAELEEAIRQGIDIPEYAWHPLPKDLDLEALRSSLAVKELRKTIKAEAERSGRRTDEVIGDLDDTWKYKELADVMRAEGVHDNNPFCYPRAGCDFLRDAEIVHPVCHWGIFNPFGPTMNFLFLVPVKGCGIDIIYYQSLNPFVQHGVVFGALRSQGVRSTDCVATTMHRLFERNGSDDYPLVKSLPSYVAWSFRSCEFDSAACTDAFFKVVQRFGPEEVQQHADLLRRYKGRPWDRASEELDRGVLSILGKDASESSVSRPMTEAQFAGWFLLVADPRHYLVEMAAMETAWNGAIKHTPRLPGALEPLSFEVAFTSLRKFMESH